MPVRLVAHSNGLDCVRAPGDSGRVGHVLPPRTIRIEMSTPPRPERGCRRTHKTFHPRPQPVVKRSMVVGRPVSCGCARSRCRDVFRSDLDAPGCWRPSPLRRRGVLQRHSRIANARSKRRLATLDEPRRVSRRIASLAVLLLSTSRGGEARARRLDCASGCLTLVSCQIIQVALCPGQFTAMPPGAAPVELSTSSPCLRSRSSVELHGCFVPADRCCRGTERSRTFDGMYCLSLVFAR